MDRDSPLRHLGFALRGPGQGWVSDLAFSLAQSLCYFWACGITPAESFLKESSKIQPTGTTINPKSFCFFAYEVLYNYSVISTVGIGEDHTDCRFEGHFLLIPFYKEVFLFCFLLPFLLLQETGRLGNLTLSRSRSMHRAGSNRHYGD